MYQNFGHRVAVVCALIWVVSVSFVFGPGAGSSAQAAVVKYVTMDPRDENRVVVEMIRGSECIPSLYRLQLSTRDGFSMDEFRAELVYVDEVACENEFSYLVHDQVSLALSDLELSRDVLSGHALRVRGDVWRGSLDGKRSEAIVNITP